ncbi:MAG: glycosyltransferase 87 family protein [Pseudorhizobium sp.]
MKRVFVLGRWEPVFAMASLMLSFLCLYAVGIAGVGKSAPLGDDFSVFYRAGTLFLNGNNPWLALATTGQPFSYPPHALTLLSLYAALPTQVALTVHLLISILAIGVICYCANAWFLNVGCVKNMTLPQALGFALIIGNPYTATSLYQGQTTLLVTAALLLSWLFLTRGHKLAAGLLLAVATFKPQLSLFYLLWLILSVEVFVLAAGALFAAVLLLPSVMAFGMVGTFVSWIDSLGSYADISINMPGSPFVVGLESLLVAHGFAPASVAFLLFGALATGLLFLLRKHLGEFEQIQMLLALSCTFLFVHDYDYVVILLIWSALLHHALMSRSLAKPLAFGILAVGFFIPQRLLRDIDLPTVVHARTLILVVAVLVFLVWRHAQSQHAATAPGGGGDYARRAA